MVVIENKQHPEADVSNVTSTVKDTGAMETKQVSFENAERSLRKEQRTFDQFSKDGDTLEIGKNAISDVMLKGYSEMKLKLLYNNQEISRQQYDRAMNRKIIIS